MLHLLIPAGILFALFIFYDSWKERAPRDRVEEVKEEIVWDLIYSIIPLIIAWPFSLALGQVGIDVDLVTTLFWSVVGAMSILIISILRLERKVRRWIN